MDSKDAVDLPIRLAVALLKDTQGNIDIQLPVQGDLNNPEFSVMPIVWQTLRNLVLRAAQAPFKFIAGLVGGSDVDLSQVQFAAGSDELDGAAQKTLDTLAAAVLLMSADKAKALGLPVLARIAAYANAGVDPAIMGIGPVSATRRCLDKAGWQLADLDLIEANEAFAAQALSVGKELGWDAAKVNVNGGAIALGHPIGASGCRVLVTLLHEMIKRDAKKGLATLCIGGGQGVALAIERA